MACTGWPLMPPPELIWSTTISASMRSSAPSVAPGPVTSSRMPILMGVPLGEPLAAGLALAPVLAAGLALAPAGAAAEGLAAAVLAALEAAGGLAEVAPPQAARARA